MSTLENYLYEKGPFDACLLSWLIFSRLDCKKGDFINLHACVIQGVTPNEFPPCAENLAGELFWGAPLRGPRAKRLTDG